MLQKLFLDFFHRMIELGYLGSIKALLHQVFVVVLLVLLLHELSHQVDFLELPIGYYPVDLLLDEVAALLLLDYHMLPGVRVLLVWSLLTIAHVVALPHQDLVKVEDLKFLMVDALPCVFISIIL